MTALLRLYADENVSGTLVRALVRLRWDVIRAIDTHPPGTEDRVHFRTASEQGRVLLTHDTDMLVLAAEMQTAGVGFPGVLYCAANKHTVGEAIRALQTVVADLDTRPVANLVHFL